MRKRPLIFIVPLLGLGCSIDRFPPGVVDPEHPERRHLEMFFDFESKWPTTQPVYRPAEGEDAIKYKVCLRVSEYRDDLLKPIYVAIVDNMDYRPESLHHDSDTDGFKVEGWFVAEPDVSTSQIVKALTEAVWKANGGFCRVQVGLVCMRERWRSLGPAEYRPF